jgi:hypothetical protein
MVTALPDMQPNLPRRWNLHLVLLRDLEVIEDRVITYLCAALNLNHLE